jgi:hypothetical protein
MHRFGFAVRLAVAGTLTALAALTASAQANPVWLDVPEAHLHVNADEAATLKLGPIHSLSVHLARQPQDVPYSSITVRINTEVANVALTERAAADGIVCDVDLLHDRDLQLRPGRNSIEVIFRDRWNQPLYASFLLELPGGEHDNLRRPSHPAKPPYAEGQRYALVVGIGRYKFSRRGVQNLAYAEGDSSAFRDFMLQPRGGNIPAANLKYLLNDDATLDNIKQALAALAGQTRPEDTLILYLNLQGAYDPSNPDHKYLLAFDSDPSDMKGTALSLNELPNFLSLSSVSRHVVVVADTCHQRAVGGEGDPQTLPQNLVNLYLARAFSASGQATLEASDAQQLSHDGAKWGNMGVFTYFLMKGLAGAADSNGDGSVTADELFRYVQFHVSDDTFDQQLPIAAPGTVGNTVLAGLSSQHKSHESAGR